MAARFPVAGMDFYPAGETDGSGRAVPPIHWWAWLAGAVVAGTAFAMCVRAGSATLALLLGPVIGLIVLALPLKMRQYRRPSRSALRVDRGGLHVRRHGLHPTGGKYLDLPWLSVGRVAVSPGLLGGGATIPSLRIQVADHALAGVRRHGGGWLVDDTGSIVLEQIVTLDLIDAVTYYSGKRCPIGLEGPG